mmetsp:Transcript_18031/g.30568  ORF Transcript_18031/g.30568 Transcript_18031/m.30568 type:complete len:83 (+) Transcript_18031:445-693(+)
MMDSSPMTQGAANSFLPKKASRTDMERVVVAVVVGAMAMVRRRAVEVAGEVKALAEPRADDARMSREEWLWRGMILLIIVVR